MYIVSYEFLESVGDGGIMDDFVYEGIYIDCVEGLGKIYCYECCAVGGLFLIESSYYGVYY